MDIGLIARDDHNTQALPPIVMTQAAATHPTTLYPLTCKVSHTHSRAVDAAYVS